MFNTVRKLGRVEPAAAAEQWIARRVRGQSVAAARAASLLVIIIIMTPVMIMESAV